MAEEVQVLLLEVEITKYARDMSLAASLTRRTDASLTALDASAKRAKKSLDSLGTSVNVKVSADTSDLDKAEAELRALEGTTPDVVVTTDISDLLRADALVGTLDGATPDVVVVADDSDLTVAKRKVDEVDGESINVTVNTDDSKLDDIRQQLETIKRLSVIELVLNSKGAIEGLTGFVKNLPGVSTITDLNSAVRVFTAQTGQEFEGIGEIIDNVFTNNLGESREQIAQVTAQLVQMGVPFKELEDAAISAFNAQAVTGFDLNDIIRTQNQLVQNFGITYTEAADLIVSGFQQGGDQADDFLDTIKEYSPFLQQLGFDAGSSLGLIVAGLDQGAFNADKLGDTFKELGIRVEEALTTREGATFDALTKLGLVDEAEALRAGEITGAAFAEAAINAVNEGKGEKFDLFEIFGTPLEDLGDAFFNIDFSAIGETVIPEDAAQGAADELFDTLDNAWIEFTRTVEVTLARSLVIGGQPLTALLEQAKTNLQELADLLQDGTEFPEAFEVAFSVPGFSESVNDFIVGMGNVVIDFELALASVLEFLGKGDAAASLRSDAANRAETQLAFDLQFADSEEEIQDAVERAFNRGVDNAGISDSVNTAVNEALGAGKIDQAQSIIDAVDVDQVIAKISSGVFSQTATFTNPEFTGQTNEEIAAQLTQAGQEQGLEGTTVEIVGRLSVDTDQAQDAIDQAVTTGNILASVPVVPIAPDDQTVTADGEQLVPGFGGVPITENLLPGITVPLQEELDATTEKVGDLDDGVTTTTDNITTAFETAGDAIIGVITNITTNTDNLGDTGADGVIAYGDTTEMTTSAIIDAWNAVIAVIDETAAAAAEAASATPTATPTPTGTPRGFAGGGDFPAGLIRVGESGPELLLMPQAGHVYDTAQSAAIMQGLSALSLASMSSADNRSYQYNINQNFVAQGGAQAVSQAAVVARKIRSGG